MTATLALPGHPSHRWAAVLLAACLGGAPLTGCGTGDPAGDGGPKTAAAPGTNSGFPVTITHAMGTTVIKSQPRRVVVMDTGELDDVTLLGITPVGAVSPHMKTEGGFPSYLKDKIRGTKDVGPLEEPNLELIASLHPDLILSSKIRHEKIYDKLSAVAPTVFTQTTGFPWKANLAVHAKALGRQKQAKVALADYAKRARDLGARIRAKNHGKPLTASVVRFVAGPTRLYQKASYSGVVLDDIGFDRPASQRGTNPVEQSLDVGPEQIDKAEADVVFVAVADDPSKTQRRQVAANPVWRDLTAVRNHAVFDVPDETWMSGIGVQAASLMLADVAKATGVDLP